MLKPASCAASAMLLAAAFAVNADEHEEAPTYSPVETYTCNYNDGKGPKDLDKVVDEWNKFMNEKGVGTYFAVTLTPHYHGPDAFDLGWLGAWPTGQAMGEGTDMWLAEGREIAGRFAAVADCDTHANFASMQVKEPPSETPPDTVVLSFSDCNLHDGKTMDEAIAGMAAFAQYQTDAGMPGGTWIWWPVFGGGDAGFDFKLVDGYPNHATLGKLYDWYGNGGAYMKWEEHVGSNVSCDVARIYDGKVRRRMAAE